jgi:hypothetical protein
VEEIPRVEKAVLKNGIQGAALNEIVDDVLHDNAVPDVKLGRGVQGFSFAGITWKGGDLEALADDGSVATRLSVSDHFGEERYFGIADVAGGEDHLDSDEVSGHVEN